MTVREIQGHLEELYGVEVSPSLISNVTDEVLEEVKAWQSRALEKVYPILWLDGLRVSVNQEGRVSQRTIYVAWAVNLQGHKEVFGLWGSEKEGEMFRVCVSEELKKRGVAELSMD